MASEREFTRSLARFFGTAKGLSVGIGDDAAVVRNPARNSVLCCDPVVEGVHFLADTPPPLVGQKAVNRNLADLAAMGAVADWLLVSLVLPADYPSAHCMALLRGVRKAARAGGCTVVGGDVASTHGPLVVTVTAVGHLPGRALTRSGARVGDHVCVSGPLGGSRLGAHLRFRPPLAEGRWLATQRAVSAAMDVSDGLLLDLATMLTASGVPGAELDVAAIPIAAAARRAARASGRSPLQHALADGEDHVLLWTQRGRQLAAGGPLVPRAREPLGRVIQEPGLWLIHPNGRRERVEPLGFQHRLSPS